MKGLKERRVACGMTQDELAKAVGVSQVVISILEREDIEAGAGLGAAIDNTLDKPSWKEQSGAFLARKIEPSGKKTTQTQRVLDYLRKHGSITQQDAINAFSCYRLAAKIFDLRQDGYVIKTEKVPFANDYTNGYYAVYTLVGEGQ